MTDWSGQSYLDALAQGPGAIAPKSLGEIWQAEWASAGLDTISGVGQPYLDAENELRDAIEQGSGKSIGDLAAEQNINLGAATSRQARAAALGQLAATLPEDKQKQITPLLDIRKRASDKAHAIERDAADASSAAYGLSGTATAFAAGVARQAVDPFNLGAMALTAPLGGIEGGALLTIGKEALGAGLAQAAVEPVIEPARGELGLEHGFGRAAVNVAGAAGGAAALTGGLMGLGVLFRRAAGALRDRQALPPPAAQPGAPAPAADNGERAFTGYMSQEEADFIWAHMAPAQEKTASVADVAGQIGPEWNFDFAQGAQAAPTTGKTPIAPEVQFEPTFRGHVGPEDSAWIAERGRPLPPAQHTLIDMPDRVGPAGNFEIAPGAMAPTKEKTVAPVGPWEPSFGGWIGHDDANWLHEVNAPAPRPIDTTPGLGAAGDTYTAGGFDIAFSPKDFEAAAQLADRDHLIAAHAPEKGAAAEAEHHARVEDAAAALEENRPTSPTPADVIAPRARRPKVTYRSQSLLEFLAGNGGLSATDPLASDLRSMFGGENPFIPGYGRLIRENGKKFDVAREAAAEGRYIGADGTTVRDLLDAIGEEAGGNRVFPAGEEGTLTKVELAAAREREAVQRQEAAAANVKSFDTRMREVGIEKPAKALKDRALQLMEREGITDPLAAYERALIEHEDRQEAKRAARYAEPDQAIPGFDVPHDAGAAPAPGGNPAREVPQRSGDAAAGGPARENSGGDRAGAAEPVAPAGADQAAAIEAQRATAEQGGDFQITIPDENGNPRQVSAAQALREVEADAQAAAEFKACVEGKSGNEPPF